MICLMKKTWSPDIWLSFYPFSSQYIYYLKTSPGQNILLIYTFLSTIKIYLLCVLHSTRIKHLPMLFHIVWWRTIVYLTCLCTSCHVYGLSNFESWSFMQWRPAIMIARLTVKNMAKRQPDVFQARKYSCSLAFARIFWRCKQVCDSCSEVVQLGKCHFHKPSWTYWEFSYSWH